ncbi:hypothetical protein TNCV_1251811 [Trichonephila clavipes]|nr:hypothetical protein TNCV_1251811 [Trichonephila clavipes]
MNENNSTQQEKTTQLGNMNDNSTGNMNETTQQDKTTQLSSMNEQLNSGTGTETPQLVSRNETTQLCTAVDRLYSRIGFLYLLSFLSFHV